MKPRSLKIQLGDIKW